MISTASKTGMHDPRKFEFIDALRGLAILAVILVHAHLAAPPASPWLQTLMAGGARGVQLFYIASALTLCLSWEFRSAHERAPVRNFYLRRLFRIVPMFYVAIAVYVMLYGLAPRTYAPNGVEWYYIPLTALFLNGFHPETVTSVVPGGWSIVVEMTFYLVLPFLVTRFRTLAALLALVALSLILDRVTGRVFRAVYLPMYPPDQAYIVHNFTFLNFFGQFPVFAVGMLAYWAFRSTQGWNQGPNPSLTTSRRPQMLKTAVTVAAALFVAWLLIWIWLTGANAGQVLSMHVVMGVAFALLALGLAVNPARLLVNPLTRWIGKLSFSMYLTHFAVLDAFAALGISGRFGRGDIPAGLHYLCVVTVAAAVSWVCYRWIERPGIDAGRRLIDRLEAAPIH